MGLRELRKEMGMRLEGEPSWRRVRVAGGCVCSNYIYYIVQWKSQKLFKIIQEWKGNEVGTWSWQLKTYDTPLMISHYVLVYIIAQFIISERQVKLFLLMYKERKLCTEKLRMYSGIIYNLAQWHKCSHDKQRNQICCFVTNPSFSLL